MYAPLPPPALQLRNCIGANARVRLHCGERQIWDVWVSAGGMVSSPALAPQRITLLASLTEAPSRVFRSATLQEVPEHGRYLIRLRQDRGALLFMLSAVRDDDVAGLWLTNTTRWATDFRLSVCASPYEMTGHLAPGASLVDAWTGPLSLDVIVEGFSLSLPLAAAAGHWQIEATAEPPGFQVVACNRLTNHKGLA